MTSKTAEFRKLHEAGCFVMPNPWDRGSAIYLASLGFKALASSSAGFAWAGGHADNRVTRDQVLEHLRVISDAVPVPVNADFEDGFAVEPAEVGKNVALATKTGIAGLSIEDSTRSGPAPLYDIAFAAERIRAARGAIDASGTGIVLTGRAEGFISGVPDLDDVIRRLQAYSEAGADCLFAPGLKSKSDIAAVVGAIAPKPFNLVVSGNFITVAEAASLGVRRISTGGALARSAWNGVAHAAREIATHGTFSAFAPDGPALDLNGLFQ